MYRFEFELTTNEYIKYNVYHQSHSPYFRQRNLLSRIGIPIIFVVIIIFAIASGLSFEKTIIMAIVCALISLLYNLFFNFINIRILTREVKEMGKDGRLPFAKHSKFTFEENAFTEITPDAENSVSYDQIEKIIEYQDLIFVYTSSLVASIIPQSVFDSPEEKEKFISFLESKSGIQRGEHG